MRGDAIAWKYVSRTPAGRSRTAMGMPGVTNTSHFKGSERIAKRYGTRASASRPKKPRIRPPRSRRFGWGIVLGHARVGLVVAGDFQIMSCAAVAAFDVANIFAGKPFYRVRVISERGGVVRSSVGVGIETARLSGAYDTLLVAGPTAIAPTSKGVLAYLRREAAQSRRVASICTGAFVRPGAETLVAGGATTHWLFTREL